MLPSPTFRGVARNHPHELEWMLDYAMAVLDDPNDPRHVTAMAFLVEVSLLAQEGGRRGFLFCGWQAMVVGQWRPPNRGETVGIMGEGLAFSAHE